MKPVSRWTTYGVTIPLWCTVLRCRLSIDVGAQSFQADDLYVGTHNPLDIGQEYKWPIAHTAQDP